MSEEKYPIPIELLGLSARSYHCLKRSSIHTVGDLLQLSTKELLKIKNLGKGSAREIEDTLKKMDSGELFFGEILSVNADKNMPQNVSCYMNDKSVRKKEKKTVLHYINEMTVTKEVSDVMFYDANGLLRDNIDIKEMLLSTRAAGTLRRNGYTTAKQIVNAYYEDIIHLKSMGDACLADIMNRLKEITFLQFREGENKQFIEECTKIICTDIKEKCPGLKESSYESQIKAILYKNEEFIPADNILENRELMNKIYSESSIYKIFENQICVILLEFSTLSLYSLKQKMPVGLQTSHIFEEIVNNLTKQGKIDYTENGLQYHLLTVLDYTKLMKEGNQKTALLCRLQGMTLEEAGSIIGVTRERVRQLTKKAVEQMPKLREDDFKYWYENYNITKEEFKSIFALTEESYHYLKGTYKKGMKSLEDIFQDEHITGAIAQRTHKEMKKYCVMIGDEYVPIKREVLVKKLLQVHYSDKECSVAKFYQLYLDFLKIHGLDAKEKLLFPSERAFESRLDNQRYVLIKYGRKIRYYNMDEYDIDNLFLELGFESYKNLEISTLKLFNIHRELMNEYNILDEYELHNLMKKNEDKLISYNITVNRMPFISIGIADREQQVIQLLYKTAPIDIVAFGDAYEKEFGVKSETVCANFVQYINKYYENGIFSVDYIVMSSDEYKLLGNKLIEDLYFIEDVRNMYKNIFPNGNIEKVNPYNLKTMGFKVYVNYIIRDTYSSSEDYFRQLLTKQDRIDLNLYDKRIIDNSVFSSVLEELRVNFHILEFERNKYLTFDRFKKEVPDITKEDLRQFAFDAAKFEEEDFFTIKSMRRKGFINKIGGIGFGDWFYGALLRSNKTIRYSKAGGTFLFGRMDRQFRIAEFFLFLMRDFKKISRLKFIDYLDEVYGIKYEKTKLTYLIGQGGMYYDSTTKKIYLNKEEYYEDI